MTWRDLMCGEPRSTHVGDVLTLSGWAARRRDHGGLVFVDLRDHTGVTQLVINPERSAAAAELAKEIRNEFVLRARGEVVARSPETVNAAMPTGEVELQVDELEIVSRSTPLPFQLDEEGVDETLRLRYRWLDLRSDRMQRSMRMSHSVISSIRQTMDGLGFIDVWTPSMTRGTPEGARDFVVPVRLQPGLFFALAQSPQIFKQLCMIGGLDRYYQIATCWRDEDLRADRQFEFRQLDLELAFVEREDVLDVLEQVVVNAFAGSRARGTDTAVSAPDVRGGARSVRHRQAGPALRPRDPGCDRGDAQLRVRRLRNCRDRALPRRAARVLADGAATARGGREGVGSQGSRVPRLRRRRGAVADREVPVRGGARGIPKRAGLDRALRSRRRGDGRARARRPSHPSRS